MNIDCRSPRYGDVEFQNTEIGGKLWRAAADAIGLPLLALGISGSSARGLSADVAQDIDLIGLADVRHRQRLRVPAFGRVLDIVQETPASIANEFAAPCRIDMLRLLSSAFIIADTDRHRRG